MFGLKYSSKLLFNLGNLAELCFSFHQNLLYLGTSRLESVS